MTLTVTLKDGRTVVDSGPSTPAMTGRLQEAVARGRDWGGVRSRTPRDADLFHGGRRGEDRGDAMTFVCAYTGNPSDCPECGGFVPAPGARQDRFCGDDCAASCADRVAAQGAAQQARRDREDAFGREVDRLRGLGYTDVEIDVLLAGMPT